LPLTSSFGFIGAMFAVPLLGWFAGGLANLAADVLPKFGERRERTPSEATDTEVARPQQPMPEGDPAYAAADPSPASMCHAPSHYLTLPWYFLRDRSCAHCHKRIAWRHPAVEGAMMVLFLAAWQRASPNLFVLAVSWIYISFLVAVLVIDFEHRLVLNIMLVPAAACALALSFLPGMLGPLSALLGGVAGLGLFLLLALVSRGHMGAGDIKLAAVIGLMLGFPAGLWALLAGVVLGGLGAIVLLVTRRAGRKSYMAYGPYLSLGALVVLLRLIAR
jgi:leader peptidase (prepilin peptidase) / N-methyltransferase